MMITAAARRKRREEKNISIRAARKELLREKLFTDLVDAKSIADVKQILYHMLLELT